MHSKAETKVQNKNLHLPFKISSSKSNSLTNLSACSELPLLNESCSSSIRENMSNNNNSNMQKKNVRFNEKPLYPKTNLVEKLEENKNNLNTSSTYMNMSELKNSSLKVEKSTIRKDKSSSERSNSPENDDFIKFINKNTKLSILPNFELPKDVFANSLKKEYIVQNEPHSGKQFYFSFKEDDLYDDNIVNNSVKKPNPSQNTTNPTKKLQSKSMLKHSKLHNTQQNENKKHMLNIKEMIVPGAETSSHHIIPSPESNISHKFNDKTLDNSHMETKISNKQIKERKPKHSYHRYQMTFV